MEVILREEVAHLGGIGEVVRVRPGYARNYLIPRGFAVLADRRNRGQLEHQKRLAEEKRDRVLAAARSLAQRISAAKVEIRARAGDEGRLFGSVTNIDIERALVAQGLQIERRRIRIDDPIKAVGDVTVTVHLGSGITTELTVSVRPLEEPPSP